MSEQTNPAVTFYSDIKALREKYPMAYIEVWTPNDFIHNLDDDDEVGGQCALDLARNLGRTPAIVDWNHPFHEITADNLQRHFDAEIGTNWDRIREESVSIK